MYIIDQKGQSHGKYVPLSRTQCVQITKLPSLTIALIIVCMFVETIHLQLMGSSHEKGYQVVNGTRTARLPTHIHVHCTCTCIYMYKIQMYMHVHVHVRTRCFTLHASTSTFYISIIHRPSFQGWAPECLFYFVFVCLYFTGVICWVWVSFLSSLPPRLP